MPKETIAELKSKLQQAYSVIESQQKQIAELHKKLDGQGVVTVEEYNGLLRQHEALKSAYNLKSRVGT